MLLPRHVLKNPALYQSAFSPKVVQALKIALGAPYVQWMDFQIQRNMFGGWHIDAGSENNASYLSSKEYAFVKCGLFLQDTTKEFGGGIDVGLFSHYKYKARSRIFKRVVNLGYTFLFPLFKHTLKINVGDFVFFDSRLLHSSSMPEKITLKDVRDYSVYPLPHENAKYVLYWNTCNSFSMEGFMTNSMIRALRDEYVPKAKEVFFLRLSVSRIS